MIDDGSRWMTGYGERVMSGGRIEQWE